MSDTFLLYELKRSARKTLSIQVTNEGKVVVRAPLKFSINKIESFIMEKYDWIVAQVHSVNYKKSLLPKLKDGESITILSRTFKIVLCDDLQDVFECNNELFLPRNNAKKHLKSYVCKMFLPYITEKTHFFAKKYGFYYKAVKLTSAHSRWGSCSVDNVIRYNISLALLPEKVCDGVVIHELCHTVAKNHGKSFYAILYKVMPDYDSATLLRKEYGAFCSFFSEDYFEGCCSKSK